MRDAIVASYDRGAIITMLVVLGLAIALVLGGLIQDHHGDNQPDACMCECP